MKCHFIASHRGHVPSPWARTGGYQEHPAGWRPRAHPFPTLRSSEGSRRRAGRAPRLSHREFPRRDESSPPSTRSFIRSVIHLRQLSLLDVGFVLSLIIQYYFCLVAHGTPAVATGSFLSQLPCSFIAPPLLFVCLVLFLFYTSLLWGSPGFPCAFPALALKSAVSPRNAGTLVHVHTDIYK